jgi:triacylglycerol lipase
MFAMISAIAGVFACAAANAAEPAYDVVRGKTYVDRDTGALAADLYVPKGAGPYPGMLVVHGGAWRLGARGQLAPIAAALAEKGYTAMAISYRLAPASQFPAQLHDCQAAVRWLREHAEEYKIDSKRIGGFGYSAGGQLVALLGALDDSELREPGVAADAPSARLQLVLAGGAPCDFRIMPAGNDGLAYWLGGSRGAKPQAYHDASAAAFVSADDPPMFFFHGEQDELVPVASPREMVALLKLRGVKTDIYTIPKAGHMAAIIDRDALERGLAFADENLKSKGDVTRTTAPPARAADPSPSQEAAQGGPSNGK